MDINKTPILSEIGVFCEIRIDECSIRFRILRFSFYFFVLILPVHILKPPFRWYSSLYPFFFSKRAALPLTTSLCAYKYTGLSDLISTSRAFIWVNGIFLAPKICPFSKSDDSRTSMSCTFRYPAINSSCVSAVTAFF